MTVVFRQFWPEHNLTLRAYRAAYREHCPEDDRPAMLGCRIDEDGCYQSAPFTIKDAAWWISRLLDDDDGLAAA